MQERAWLAHYPEGIPAEIDLSRYTSLVALMEQAFAQHAGRVAFNFMGKDMSFAELDRFSQAFAAYLQSLGLA